MGDGSRESYNTEIMCDILILPDQKFGVISLNEGGGWKTALLYAENGTALYAGYGFE